MTAGENKMRISKIHLMWLISCLIMSFFLILYYLFLIHKLKIYQKIYKNKKKIISLPPENEIITCVRRLAGRHVVRRFLQFDHLFVGEMRPIVDEGVRVVGVAVGTYRRLGDFTAKDGRR